MEEAAQIYVNYIVPGAKVFAIFLLVLLVLALWAKAREGKLIDMAGAILEGTINYTYKAIYYFFLGIWMFCVSVIRVFRVIFATIRDFFMSRI